MAVQTSTQNESRIEPVIIEGVIWIHPNRQYFEIIEKAIEYNPADATTLRYWHLQKSAFPAPEERNVYRLALLYSLAPSGAASGHALMPLLTELGSVIHRITINIALLTERKSLSRCQ